MTARKKSIVFAGLLAAILALGLVSVVEARDYCISAFELGLVIKGFAPPTKGSCKGVTGYIESSFANSSSGSACTASDGTHVTIEMTNQAPQVGVGVMEVFEFPLPVGSGVVGTGHSAEMYPSLADNGDLGLVSLVACAKPTPPAP